MCRPLIIRSRQLRQRGRQIQFGLDMLTVRRTLFLRLSCRTSSCCAASSSIGIITVIRGGIEGSIGFEDVCRKVGVIPLFEKKLD